jgi:hypothetical protein
MGDVAEDVERGVRIRVVSWVTGLQLDLNVNQPFWKDHGLHILSGMLS